MQRVPSNHVPEQTLAAMSTEDWKRAELGQQGHGNRRQILTQEGPNSPRLLAAIQFIDRIDYQFGLSRREYGKRFLKNLTIYRKADGRCMVASNELTI